MLVTEISSKRKFIPSEAERNTSKERIKKLQKEGEKLIKGMFEFTDARGGWIDFSYRYFPGEPIRTVHIVHGEVIDIPTVLMRHINNTYKKVRMLPENLDKGAPVITKLSRMRFTPMEAM